VSIIERALNKASQQSSENEDSKRVAESGPVEEASVPIPQPDKPPSSLDGLESGTVLAAPHEMESSALSHRVDWARLREAGILTPEAAAEDLAERYREIARPLLEQAFPDTGQAAVRGNLIQIVSSARGEGSTFTALNLAIAMAGETDKIILLVDANVMAPAVSRLLGIEEKVGLINLLDVRYVRVSDVLWRTQIPNLRVIPAGKLPQRTGELLGSPAMRLLTRELSERYSDRLVIFDSPPLSSAPESEVLAGQMGQVVLVVRAEHTATRAVLESVEKLRSCRVAGCVLNRAREGYSPHESD
jgi:protein-tyrosine kinase